MNKDLLSGQWKEIKGKIKEAWGKLTDDDLTEINGKREALLGKLQKYYGYSKERAEEEFSKFEQKCSSSCGCEKSAKSHEKHDLKH